MRECILALAVTPLFSSNSCQIPKWIDIVSLSASFQLEILRSLPGSPSNIDLYNYQIGCARPQDCFVIDYLIIICGINIEP